MPLTPLRRSLLLLLAVLPLVAGTLVTAGSAPAGAAAPIPRPHDDPFYTYDGATPLAQIAPGTVLKTRKITLSLGSTLPTPLSADQLLYRTVDQLGRPAVTVTTVVAPLGPISALRGVVGYLSFYDALGDICSPSYTLRGGDAGTEANNSQAQIEAVLITTLAAQGYAVTVPDFEGVDLHWVAGHESGWSTLDSVRATQAHLGMDSGTKVGLFGYSGGSIAGEWAAELAPSYSPELNLSGVAIGGIPVNLASNFRYVNGSQTWSGVMPAVMVSLGRAFDIDLRQYQSEYGRSITDAVADQCIGSFNGAYPGLRAEQLLLPQHSDFLAIPDVARTVNRLLMGSTPGHPTSPMLMLAGNSDGTGDGVMVARDQQALAHQYCQEGVPVDFRVADGADHTAAGAQFFVQGQAWLMQAMAGAPTSNCASIGPGNDLSPLPVRETIHPRLKAKDRGRRDAVKLRAPGAEGAVATVYRLGKRKPDRTRKQVVVARGTVGADGRLRVRVKDRNGGKVTRYRVVVDATDHNQAARTKVARAR